MNPGSSSGEWVSMKSSNQDRAIRTTIREADNDDDAHNDLTSPGSSSTQTANSAEPLDNTHTRDIDPLDDDNNAGMNSINDRPNQQYKVYKRRFFGLTQLVLLNIIISWDWLTFSAISTTSASFFKVSENAINWLSTGVLFAFVVISPLTLWTLNKGPKLSIITAAAFAFLGNWVRYGGARSSSFGVVMLGQVLIGFGQPFVLAAPTRYSDLWFTDRGRISATAVASLANPLGGALGQLISPLWVSQESDIPNMVLFTAIISSVACIPSFFIPAAPPTPPSASSALPKTPLKQSLLQLAYNKPFYLLFIPFSIYAGFFNALSSVLNQVLEPYGFSEDQAGIGGALLILVGLAASAICSPIVDRTHAYRTTIKILVPIIGICYLALIWAPQTRSLVAPYIILSILGAASFATVPVVLEYLVEITFPASPEVTSVICWTGSQVLGGIFIIIMSALKADDGDKSGGPDRPAGNMYRALVFEAVIACLAVPLPLLLGSKRLGLAGEGSRRFVVDERGPPHL